MKLCCRKIVFLSLIFIFALPFNSAFASPGYDGVIDDTDHGDVIIRGSDHALNYANAELQHSHHVSPELKTALPQPTHHYAAALACGINSDRNTNCSPKGCTVRGEQGIQYALLQAPQDQEVQGAGTIIDRADAHILNQWRTAGSFCSAALPFARDQLLAEAVNLSMEDVKALGLKPSILHGPQFGGKTLIKYETNFWVEPLEQNFTTQVLGLEVQVRAKPVRFVFDYGDGSYLATEETGYFLSDDEWDVKTPTSHVYESTGVFEASVTTFYVAEFSVAGGPWVAVEGEGEVVSGGVGVDVWRTVTRLVPNANGR